MSELRSPQLCGFPRKLPFLSQETVRKDMAHLLRWVEECSQDAVEAVRNLERSKRDLGTTNLLCIRQLLTPASRKALLPVMLAPGARLPDAEREAGKLADEMWMEFHWSDANPAIHADVCMFLPCVVCCSPWPGSMMEFEGCRAPVCIICALSCA